MDTQSLQTLPAIYQPEAELIEPGDDSIQVSANPQPFCSENVQRRYPAGTTLAEILEDLVPNPALRRCAHVFIAGDRIPHAHLHHVRPKPGHLVNIIGGQLHTARVGADGISVKVAHVFDVPG